MQSSRSVCGLILLAAALSVGALRAQSVRIADEASLALESDGVVRVWVELADPADAVSPAETEAERCRRRALVQERLVRELSGAGLDLECRASHRFVHSPVVALEVRSRRALDALAGSRIVRRVSLDLRGGGALDEGRGAIRADEVHAVLDVLGEGTTVAVLDTGIDSDHPDLRDAIVHEYHVLDEGDDAGPGAEDDHGHGSHIAGIIASRGTVSPLGVAPGASIVAIKVLDDRNRGWISDWARAVEYVVELHDRGLASGIDADGEPGVLIDAVNLSMASDVLFDDVCDGSENAVIRALGEACRAAADRGMLIVGASGNHYSTDSMASPSCFSSVVSVGAVQDTLPDRILSFTNRNEHLDLLAPGELITSIGLGTTVRERRGTSQAAAFVAGVACLLREARPGLSPERALAIMRTTGAPVSDDGTGLTYPRIDAMEVMREALSAEITGLACAWDPGEATLRLDWDPVASGRPVVVELLRGGEVSLRRTLPEGSDSFLVGGLASGHYEACLTVASPDGGAACCEVDVLSPRFRRADCNGDLVRDVSDSVFLLLALFADRNSQLRCPAACDSNDDGELDLADAIFSLNFLFRRGPRPPPPYPGCGVDVTPGGPGCAATPCP